MPRKAWDEIIYPFKNFDGCTIDVLEWISNFHPTLNNGCDYLSMLGLKLNHVSKRGPRWCIFQLPVLLILPRCIFMRCWRQVIDTYISECVYSFLFQQKREHETGATSINHSFIGDHYNDVIMSAMASQITSLTIVYSTFYSGADQRKHQSSASLAFVRTIHRWSVNSQHKWPVTRKIFPFDDVIMYL